MTHVAFLVATFLMLVRPQDFVESLQTTPVMQFAMLAGLAFWATSKQSKPEIKVAIWAIAFTFSACISSGLNGWWGGAVQVVQRIQPSIVFFVLTAAATRTVPEFRRFAWLIAACCGVMVYHGWQQVTLGVGFTGEVTIEGRIRYVGILNDPNDLGVLFVIGLVSMGWMYSTSTGRIPRLLAAASAGMILYGVYLTNSRGTMLASMTAMAAGGVRRYGAAKVAAVAAIGLPILWGATRLSTLSNEEESAAGRIDAWYEGFQMLREHPLFGVGVGNFVDHHPMTAHNSLVLVMAEGGIVGYTLWFLFFGYSAILCVRAARLDDTSPPSPDRYLARAIATMGLAVFVACMFLSRSYNPVLFMVCGLAVARAAAATDTSVPEEQPALEPPLGPLTKYALISIPAMYVVTSILLRF